MKQNTFKAPLPKQVQEVHISEKEMAAYRLTSLKIAYIRDQAQTVLDKLAERRERQAVIATRAIYAGVGGSIAAAIVGLVIKHFIL